MTDDVRYFHLVPTESWERQKSGPTYVPDAYESDGFVHLTIGESNLIEVANLFYKQDSREYSVLELEKERISARVQFDDDSGRYPHVYGPLNVDAVVSVYPVWRDADGKFVGIGGT
jgi:uncharacterized protein (DUF952 family)